MELQSEVMQLKEENIKLLGDVERLNWLNGRLEETRNDLERQLSAKESKPEEPRRPKIVQILVGPENPTWRGCLIGLGDDGVVYEVGSGWEHLIPPLGWKEEA